MKVRKVFLGLIALSLLVSTSLYVLNTKKPQFANTPTPNSDTARRFTVSQTITFGEHRQSETNNVEVLEGESVLDVANRTQKTEIKEYSFGNLVESIEGVKNGTDNKYWIFYVNSEESKVGAGDYRLKPNDKIEWKFKTYEQ